MAEGVSATQATGGGGWAGQAMAEEKRRSQAWEVAMPHRRGRERGGARAAWMMAAGARAAWMMAVVAWRTASEAEARRGLGAGRTARGRRGPLPYRSSNRGRLS